MAAKRQVKAQLKAVKKEKKLIPQMQQQRTHQLGLLTRHNTPRQADQAPAGPTLTMQSQQREAAKVQKSKRGILARKRSFNELQRASSLPNRATSESTEDQLDETIAQELE